MTNHKKNWFFRLFTLLFLPASLCFESCDCVHDNYESCDVTIMVQPYFRTPCMDEATYPKNIKDIFAIVTDEQGHIYYHKDFSDVKLSPDTKLPILLPHTSTLKGKLFCTLWANSVSPDYIVSPSLKEMSQLTDFVIEPVNNSGVLEGKKLVPLYVGTGVAADLPEGPLTAPLYFETAINLVRYTNDFNVVLEIENIKKDTPLLFEIKDKNLAYYLNGDLTDPMKDVIYRNRIMAVKDAGSSLYKTSFQFSTMRLDLPPAVYGSHYAGPLVFLSNEDPSITDPKKRVLIDNLSLLDWFKSSGTNLACQFEHNLLFKGKIHDDGTHMGVEVWLDDYKVFTYDVEL